MSMSSSSTPQEEAEAGPSTPTPTSSGRPPRPRPVRRPSRCVSLDVCRPEAAPHHELERIESGVEASTPKPSSPVGFHSPPSSPTRATDRKHSDPAGPPLSAVPSYLNPGRRRAHTVSVTMPWRKGYAPLPDDVESNPRPADSPSTASPKRSRKDSRSRARSSSTDRSVSFSLPDSGSEVADHRGELHDDVVGLLDCVDPEVGTVNHLQNVTNSIMFPPIPGLYSRRPTVCLSTDDDAENLVPTLPSQKAAPKKGGRGRAESAPLPMGPKRPMLASQGSSEGDSAEEEEEVGIQKSQLEAEDKLREHVGEDMTHELDAHMRKVLTRRKRKDKLKSALRGLWAYLKTPMGIITAIYGFLVAFWGAAIVLFLLGWIPTSSKHAQDVWVEISSQVTNGLFTVTGVGLIPWRAIDTYRMGRIWTFRSRVKRRRKALGLPAIRDWNDLPDPKTIPGYVNTLTDKEQQELEHQQSKFQESQTWYRPHATATHTAFPMAWALWNTILMDLNSFFQCILCGCMWGMNYHKRPPWTTGSLIPLSFLCGIGAGILIWQGGVRTKKTKEVQGKLSKALGVEEPAEEVKGGRKRAATVGTSRPSEEVARVRTRDGTRLDAPDTNGGAGAVKTPARRATVDAAPGGTHVSRLAPLAETLEDDAGSPEKEKEKDIEMDDLALPPVPELSAIRLPGIDTPRHSLKATPTLKDNASI